MNELLGVLASISTALLGFLLGQYAERRRQSLLVRSEMLKPIEEWLAGAEKLNGTLGDTFSTVLSGMPRPTIYNMEERRKTAQFMIEKSNIVFGVLQSDSLKTWQTKTMAIELTETIRLIDGMIKTRLLPMENEILERSEVGILTSEFMTQIGQVTLGFDSLIQKAHSLISKIKTALI
jgi:hypothetical protein